MSDNSGLTVPAPPVEIDQIDSVMSRTPCWERGGVALSHHDASTSFRIALYSHDTMGVGHMRRNLLIAQSLVRSFPRATVLMVAGAKEANAFATGTGIDCLTLPSLRKDVAGDYHSRNLRLPLSELIQVRSGAIQAAMQAFQPDVFIVDKVPRGVADELMPTLESLRCHGRTRCVLGLREVLDEQTATIASWRKANTSDMIRQFFDAVWVYGDPQVFNLVSEYELPVDVAAKVSFTGYLDQRQRADFESDLPKWCNSDVLPDEPFVLCTVGGGQDGAPVAEAFIEATSHSQHKTAAVLLAGPMMPADAVNRLRRLASDKPSIRILDFVPEADWLIRRADRVVAMGGYNTVSSILSFNKPALIVPRIRPRREQLVRAKRLEALGLVDVVHPDYLSASVVRDWLDRDVDNAHPSPLAINLDGLTAIHRLLHELTCRCAS